MYLPAQFVESRMEVLHALVRAHPLGLLITQDARGGMDANPIPFLLEGTTLVAHVARGNPVWRDARTDAESLVVFQGADSYITPAWYATKAATGKVVPTWNYAVVEARGPLIVHDDPAWVRALVSRLTERHEGARALPWSIDDAPPAYVDAMLRAIVGLEIPVASLVGKWKVSQNRSPEDRDGVVAGLRAQGDDAMASLVDATRLGG